MTYVLPPFGPNGEPLRDARPRYDVREALVVAARHARLNASNFARDASKHYEYARTYRERVDVLARSEVGMRAAWSNLSTKQACVARKAHEKSRLWFGRWCALDALVRVYDDVGGAE